MIATLRLLFVLWFAWAVIYNSGVYWSGEKVRIILGLYVVQILLLWPATVFLRKRTPYGREMLDQIEGFRLYLRTAERDELRGAAPNASAAGRGRDLLPWAIALDVENEWAKAFEEAF